MYNQPLGLTVAGPTWALVNPYRSTANAENAKLLALQHSSDRIAARAWMAGIAAAAAAAIAVLVCAGAPFIAVLSAIPVGVLTGWGIDARHRYQISVARAATAALTATLGPRRLLSSQFADPHIVTITVDAVTAAHKLTTSHTFHQGLLGPPNIIGADLRIVLWDCVTAAADLDAQARILSTAGPEHSAHTQVAATVDALAAHVGELCAAAADVADLDATLTAAVTAEQVDQALAALPAPPPVVSLDVVRAHIAAAHDVIARGGQ